MSLSRVHTWVPAEVLYAADLEAEFNNILDNATDLISPLTGSIDVNSNDLTAIDELALNSAGANASASGRIRRNSANLTWHDGTAARSLWRLAVSGTAGAIGFVTSTEGLVGTDGTNFLYDDTNDLLKLFAGTAGSTIAKGIVIGPGTAPTTAPADTVQIWQADIAASHAGLHLMDEDGKTQTFGYGAHYFPETSDPASPAATKIALYAKSIDGTTALYTKTSGGTVAPIVGLPRSYLAGLTTSAAADADHDVTIAAGTCRSSDNTADITLAASITKRLDASWAVGDTNGGLDSGAIANATWYYLFVIKRPDTGVVDALFSTSATSPTMPTNYTLKRRIWAVQTKAAADIRSHIQRGDYCIWTTPVRDLNGDMTEAATARTLTVPALSVRAEISVNADWSAGNQLLLVTDGDGTSNTPDLVDTPGVTLTNNGGTDPVAAKFSVQTSALGQIVTQATGTLAGSGLNIYTYGYHDRRGRDD